MRRIHVQQLNRLQPINGAIFYRWANGERRLDDKPFILNQIKTEAKKLGIGRSGIMDDKYQIVYVDKPDDAVWSAIGRGIRSYNAQQAGDPHSQSLCFVLYNADQEIVGGLIGATYWDWCYIDLLWLKEELRGHGYGHRLLTLAEDEARQRGAKHAYLDTFSFQAPDFYQRHGDQVFGELKDFPRGHQRYFLTKQLLPKGVT